MPGKAIGAVGWHNGKVEYVVVGRVYSFVGH